MLQVPKPGLFLVTNYSMGRSVTSALVRGTVNDAILRGETMEALGLPGNHKNAGRASRVIGIKRMNDGNS